MNDKKIVDNSTIEVVLTYDTNQCTDAIDHLIQQSGCLKKAALLFDRVLENHKDCLHELTNIVYSRLPLVERNIETLTNGINEILARLRKLEEREITKN
jgi:hypothetical protein